MKGRIGGIVSLALSIAVILIFHFFYFKVLGIFGLHFSGNAYLIANFIKYAIVCTIIFVIYYRNIRAGQHSFNKTLLNSIIFSVACFMCLIFITIAMNKLLNYLGNPRGIEIGYNFTNYFNKHFDLAFALNLIKECVFMPFLLCVIFPLGFSNIFKKGGSASFLSGITYGILYGITLNTSFEVALFHSLTPAMLVVMLTYLYKTNKNIWSVIITYACYVLFGAFAINYL